MSRHWNGLITPLPMNSFLFLTYNSIDAIEPMNRLNNRCIIQHISYWEQVRSDDERNLYVAGLVLH
jgi:hypothetical protein